MHSAAHMSRFVLLSAALHFGVLAALGYNAVRPTFSSQTLTVHLFDTPAKPQTTATIHSRDNKLREIENNKTPKHPAIQNKTPSSHAERMDALNKPSNTSPPKIQTGYEPAFQQDAAEHTEVIEHITTANTAAKLAPPMTATSTSTVDRATLSNRLEAHLRHAITTHFSYPMLARRNGWQGQVQVGLRVEANGRLSHLHIAHSSGYGLLDNAALAALNRIAGLPEAADWLAGRHFDMVVPIEYRLLDGQS